MSDDTLTIPIDLVEASMAKTRQMLRVAARELAKVGFNVQFSPYPTELEELVKQFAFRPGWVAWMGYRDRDVERDEHGQPKGTVFAGGLTLTIRTMCFNSYHPGDGRNYQVDHIFEVPAATYNRESWQAWLLDVCDRIDKHEAREFFDIGGERPYAPNHGPGWDPYLTVVHSSDEDRRTSYKGTVNPG
jgi:hypothetical protein